MKLSAFNLSLSTTWYSAHHRNQQVLLTGVLAADRLLVTDGGHVGAAVAGSVGHVEVDVEAVDLGPNAVAVVELGYRTEVCTKGEEGELDSLKTLIEGTRGRTSFQLKLATRSLAPRQTKNNITGPNCNR